MNIDLYPNIKVQIIELEREIEQRQILLKQKVKERDGLRLHAKEHYENLGYLIEEASKEGRDNFNEIRMNYFSCFPDFKRIYDNVEKRSAEILRDKYEITMRERFVDKLEICKELIISWIGNTD